MNNEFLQIIEFYGIGNQQRKFWEECGELSEAITTHELKQSVEYEIPLTEIVGTKEHIAEEISDVCVLLRQFMAIYDISQEQINEIMEYKVNRQLKRINEENQNNPFVF